MARRVEDAVTPLERAALLAHSRTSKFRAKIQKAQEMIQLHPEYTVSVSWGKDSTVLAHLTTITLQVPTLIHGRYSALERFPDLDLVRNQTRSSLPSHLYWENTWVGALEMFERAGNFFLDPETPQEREAFRWYGLQSDKQIKIMGQKVMLGIRADESFVRRMLVRTKGEDYYHAGRNQYVLLPLAKWSGEDIWAYLVQNRLPWAHIYDAAFDRVRARSDFTLGAGAVSGALHRHGAWLEWQKAYPEAFGLLLDKLPEMRQIMI